MFTPKLRFSSLNSRIEYTAFNDKSFFSDFLIYRHHKKLKLSLRLTLNLAQVMTLEVVLVQISLFSVIALVVKIMVVRWALFANHIGDHFCISTSSPGVWSLNCNLVCSEAGLCNIEWLWWVGLDFGFWWNVEIVLALTIWQADWFGLPVITTVAVPNLELKINSLKTTQKPLSDRKTFSSTL